MKKISLITFFVFVIYYMFVILFTSSFAQILPNHDHPNLLVASTNFKHDWLSHPIKESSCVKEIPNFDKEQEILELIRSKKVQIHAQETVLNEKKMSIMAAEKVLSNQIQSLKVIKNEFTLEKNLNQKKVRGYLFMLSKTYEAMPSRYAAKIFDKLSFSLSSKILLGMDIRHRAKILAIMDPKKSASFTEKLLNFEHDPKK